MNALSRLVSTLCLYGGLPFCVVDIAENLGADTFMQFARALGAAVKLVSRSRRECLAIAQHAEQQIALRTITDLVSLVLTPQSDLTGQQKIATNSGSPWCADELPVAARDIAFGKSSVLNLAPEFAALFQK